MNDFNKAQSMSVHIENIFVSFLPEGIKYGNADEIRKNPYKVLNDVLECCGGLFSNNAENLALLSDWLIAFEGKSIDEILASDLKESFEKYIVSFKEGTKTLKK